MHGMRIKSHRRPFVKNNNNFNSYNRPFYFKPQPKLAVAAKPVAMPEKRSAPQMLVKPQSAVKKPAVKKTSKAKVSRVKNVTVKRAVKKR